MQKMLPSGEYTCSVCPMAAASADYPLAILSTAVPDPEHIRTCFITA